MELACISAKTEGPAAYGACLNRQIASLQSAPGIANPSGHDSETGQTTLSTPRSGVTNSETEQTALATPRSGVTKSDKSRSGGTAAHSVNPMSRFTTDNIMKVHQGMNSGKILKMFGAPKNVSQSVCGGSVGQPWKCTTWQYGDLFSGWANFTFAADSGSLILNNFDVHRN
jgi:hypothetical protein